MNSNTLSFVPKVFFPRGIYLCGNFETILSTVAFKKPLIVTSKTFKDKNKAVFTRLANKGRFYIHSGEPSIEDISKLANLFRIYRTGKAYTPDKVPLHLSHSENKGVKTGSIRF